MAADGRRQRRLATRGTAPTWAPDSRRLAYVRTDAQGRSLGIREVGIDGMRRRTLARGPLSVPADGRSLAFVRATSAHPATGEISILRGGKEHAVAIANGAESLSWSPDGRTIAFASDRDGNDELFLMNADGSGVRQLTHNAAADVGPSWSPDATELGFASDRGGAWAIWAIKTDGSHPHQLAHGGQAAVNPPVWSPDGRCIAYGRIDQPPPASPTPLIVRADTVAVVCTSAYYPDAWSPDSRQLELGPNKLGEADTIDSSCQRQPPRTTDGRPFLWAPDGSGTLPCAPFSANGCDADWQPLPTQNARAPMRVVTAAGRPNPDRQLSLRRATGSQVVVTGAVAWSPSRLEIAFGASFAGREGIAASRLDGSRLRLLTPWPDTDSRAGSSFDPVWAPGGQWLAFSSANTTDGTTFLRVIGRNAGGLRTLAVGAWPAWAPDGQRLVFETFDPTASPSGVEVVDLRTGVLRPLVPWSTSAPEWAPNGPLITFAAAAPGTRRSFVFLVRPDGSGRRRLTAGSTPVWSSDGRLLAYNAAGSVDVLRPDGTGRRRLPGVPGPGQADEKAWAPGRRLLAVLLGYGPYARRGGFVVDITTGRVRRVLDPTSATDAFGPSWSRDGRGLAFVTRSGRIYVVHADGSGGHFVRLRPPTTQ
jgi:Tol biopolymer transport system component